VILYGFYDALRRVDGSSFGIAAHHATELGFQPDNALFHISTNKRK
jgi:hypothetical protein